MSCYGIEQKNLIIFFLQNVLLDTNEMFTSCISFKNTALPVPVHPPPMAGLTGQQIPEGERP